MKGDEKSLENMLPIKAVKIVPHRDHMLFLDTLDGFGETTGQACLTIKSDNMFIQRDGQLDSVVMAELLAQLTAAHSGYEALLKGTNKKIGFLVGIKDFDIRNRVRVGDTLALKIAKEYGFDQINYISGLVEMNDSIIASGTLKLWEQVGILPQFVDSMRIKEWPRNFSPNRTQLEVVVSKMQLNEEISNYILTMEKSSDSYTCNAQLLFREDFLGFHGHFPGAPLLPGVIMLKLGALLAELCLEKSLRIIKIKQAKFARSILPDELIEAKISIHRAAPGYLINTQIVRGEEISAKFALLAQS